MNAAHGTPSGLGTIAQELSEGPVLGLIHILYGACYLIGALLIWKAYEMRKTRIKDPAASAIWGPTFLALLGVGAFLVPLIHYHMQ